MREAPMDPLEQHFLNLTRRQFFGKLTGSFAAGMGVTALSGLINEGAAASTTTAGASAAALASPHYAPKAKRVIYLHMMGGPSQLDLWDYKPKLHDFRAKDLRSMPEVYQGQRITGMTSGQSTLPIAPSIFEFKKYDNQGDGVWVSELYPHTASVADELCVMNSVYTEAINHEPGVTFLQTGSQIPGRPSMGAWLSYGLGSMNANLPSFVVLISKGVGNMQALSDRLWGSGFLPSEHQGVRFRGGTDPVLFLNDPAGITREDRRKMLDATNALNEIAFQDSLDPEVNARIAQGEMAYRMQMSVPELTDFADESQETLDMYGPDVSKPGTYANNCLLARRLAERDVRFIQLYHRGWDQHGRLPRDLRGQCRQTDQPQAALIKDLRRRGLLDDTLVVWGGEFGRTVYSQGALTQSNYGRDHHPRCFTMFMAGGGIKPGINHGLNDELGYNVLEGGVHIHDLHATMLSVLGINHERLTFRFQGRRYRLTDIHGHVQDQLLA
ncbi:MAG: DUF1501 domain-containing protein [Planctomycetota bacterium]